MEFDDSDFPLVTLWADHVELRLFVVYHVLEKRRAMFKEIERSFEVDVRLLIDYLWSIDTDRRRSLCRVPLFSYAIEHILSAAENEKAEELADISRLLHNLVRRFSIGWGVPLLKDAGCSSGEGSAIETRRLRHGFLLETGSWYRRIARPVYDLDVGDSDGPQISPFLSVTREVAEPFDAALMMLEDSVPTAYRELQSLLKTIIPIRRTPQTVGFSFDDLIGAAYVTSENGVVDTIDRLVHECGHSKLDMAHGLTPLWRDDFSRYPSPWRVEPRPMTGLIHGCFVYIRSAHVLEACACRCGPGGDRILTRARHYMSQVRSALDVVTRHAKLTRAGSRFVEALSAASGLDPSHALTGS